MVSPTNSDTIPIRPTTNQVLCPQNIKSQDRIEVKGADGELWLRVELE